MALLALTGLLGLVAWPVPATATDGAQSDAATSLDQIDALPTLRFAGDDNAVGGARRELAGLIIAGREIPEGIELLRLHGGRLYVPLRTLAQMLGASVVDEPSALRVDTPLGPARFDPGELRAEGGEVFVALALLARRLALDARFDDSAYALRINPAWPIGATPGIAAADPIRPDVSAPGADLARLRGELRVQHDDLGRRHGGRLEAGGRLGPGSWQARLQDEGDQPLRAYDYHWRTRIEGFAALLGHQTLGLHPLLSSFELSGAQAAWTNAPERLFAPLDPDRLVADRPGAVRSIRGEGPPGGLAELVIEGRVIARQRIPLDGVFEFLAVPIPIGLARIEVLVYASAVAGVPSARLDYSERASDRLLGAGEFVLHGGIGQDGNPLDDMRPDRGGAGFLRARRALGDRLTMEATMQSNGLGEQALVGADALLGPVGVVTGAWARGDAGNAWLASVDGGRGPVFWRAVALEQDAGYRGANSTDLSDRNAELGWRRWPLWEVSMLARQRRQDGQPDVDFVKPALRVRPVANLFLQARPDFFGDYVYDADWRPRRDLRVAGRHDSRSDDLRVERQFGRSWLLTASTTHDRLLDRRRDGVVGSWTSPDFGGWLVEGGLLHSEGDTGFLARAGRELLPGVQFRFEALRDPLFGATGGPQGTTASLSVLFDLGRANGRFTRGGAVHANAGAVGGALIATSAQTGDLEGVTIRLNGQPRTRTDAAGRFHIAGLAPGVYRVEMDEEGLPLELASRGDAYWAEVAAGAVTSVDFRVGLLLGAAGRVQPAEALPARSRVQALAADGRVVAGAVVDPFGWYRLDRLPPAEYRLRLLGPDGETLAERTLSLTDRFEFEQDFQLAPVEPAPGSTP